MTATVRKASNFADGLSGVRYTPTSAEEDPEDSCSDSTAGKLTYISTTAIAAANTTTAMSTSTTLALNGVSCSPDPDGSPPSSGMLPMNGDVVHSGRSLSLSTSTAATSPPISATLLNSGYPYYEYQDTDDNETEVEEEEEDEEGEGGGRCDSVVAERDLPPSSSRLPNGNPHQHSDSTLLHNHHPHQHAHKKHPHHTTNHSHSHPHHNHLGGGKKVSADSTMDLYNFHHNNGHQHRHSGLLRELSKTSLSRRSRSSGRAGSKGRCLCCMMCVFLLSTAGLGALLALAYAGKVELPAPGSRGSSSSSAGRSHTSHSNGDGAEAGVGAGGASGGRGSGQGDSVVRVQKCETRGCMETAAAILSRMNSSVNPCHDFYNYACGGYSEKTYLSWFSTRIRENPEDIIQTFRRYAIDRLSSSYSDKDSPYVKKARTLFRSCLFRPHKVDNRTQSIVASVVDSLGGLSMGEGTGGGPQELTPLVANVTRLFGASPFFKIYIRGPKRVAIKTRLSDYTNPLESVTHHDLSRSEDSRSEKSSAGSDQKLEEVLLSLLARVDYTGDLRGLVRDFLRLQANIRRTFNEENRMSSDDEEEEDTGLEAPCDDFSRSSLAQLQFRHGSYGLNWTELVLGVLSLPTARDVVICEARLSRPMQNLLEITPPEQLWRFTVLHTLLHSDLFLIVSGRRPKGRELHPFSFRSASASSGSSSAGSSGKNSDGEGEMNQLSPEEQCLDLLDYVMPSLKSSLRCDPDALTSSTRQVNLLLEHLRASLFDILKDLFRITPESSWRVTNTTVNRVKVDMLLFLKSLELGGELVHGRQKEEFLQLELKEYDLAGNLLELVQYRNHVYFQGRLHIGDYPDHVTAMGIQACFEDSSVTRPGPQLYHSNVPYAVRFGSLGTYLAFQIAEKLGIEDLLDHYSDGVLNHSAVLGLAVRLNCFVTKYNDMKLIDFGKDSYKLNGENNRMHLWKDQLTLQMVSKAWETFHDAVFNDKVLPGITMSRDQLFYLAYAQTRCEKVSERGILQHYVNQRQIPNKHRVNGPLQNLHEFYRAFHCGSSKDVCELF